MVLQHLTFYFTSSWCPVLCVFILRQKLEIKGKWIPQVLYLISASSSIPYWSNWENCTTFSDDGNLENSHYFSDETLIYTSLRDSYNLSSLFTLSQFKSLVELSESRTAGSLPLNTKWRFKYSQRRSHGVITGGDQMLFSLGLP